MTGEEIEVHSRLSARLSLEKMLSNTARVLTGEGGEMSRFSHDCLGCFLGLLLFLWHAIHIKFAFYLRACRLPTTVLGEQFSKSIWQAAFIFLSILIPSKHGSIVGKGINLTSKDISLSPL